MNEFKIKIKYLRKRQAQQSPRMSNEENEADEKAGRRNKKGI
jgi:hypothetical protein